MKLPPPEIPTRIVRDKLNESNDEELVREKCKSCGGSGAITWEAGGGSCTDPCESCEEGKYFAEHGETVYQAAYKQLLDKAANYPELATLVETLRG